jgi:LCP family protein required for cell wall assembly
MGGPGRRLPLADQHASRPANHGPCVSTQGRRSYVARHSRRKGRGGARRLLIGVNVVVALAIVVGGLTIGYTEYRLHQIKHVHIKDVVAAGRTKQSHVAKGQPASAGPPETFLIVGSDTRAGLDQSGDSAYGSASKVGGARSDTIILARLVPATKQIALLSIPRDTYLDIPGLGMQKINAALGVSPNLLVHVIESQYGIDINHYVDVDFDSFKDIADALGGVEVYFPTKVRDVNAGLYIDAPGCVNLTGNLALAFVRSREYTWDDDGVWVQEGESDLARIQRQQIFIRLLAAKAQSEGLGNPLTLNGIISGLTKNLTVDDTLSDRDLITLASTFRHVDAADITGLTMPSYASTVPTSEGPEDVLVPEKAQDQAMVAQFLAFGLTPAAAPSTTTTVASSAPGRSTTSTGHRATTTTSSTVPASSVEVTVENGSGLPGQAGATASGLTTAGFDVVGTETASSFGRTASVVEYGAGEQAAAATVAAHLEGRVITEEVAGLGPGVVLYTGSLLAGVRTTATGATSGSSSGSTSAPVPATTAPATTAPATTAPATTVPATTTTTYVLPGTPATGAPSCS